jgi:4-diphosphocytidyl-2-C-methyl-D-erythritol kinase
MTRPLRLWAAVPCKVNLGLEIIGRRPDGFHDIVTILQTVSVYDLFEWTSTGAAFAYTGPAGIQPEDDLVARVFATAPDRANWTGRLRLVKRVPVAAGMGGGSADAAAALRLAHPTANDAELHERAVRLGADVPFFLRGGTALATGIGTTLSPLPTPRCWLVIVTPSLAIERKTATLYRGLRAGDFSDGIAIRRIAAWIGDTADAVAALPNAFARQLLGYPEMRYAYDRLARAGGRLVSVSGAGPTLYALAHGYPDAARIADEVRRGAANEIGTVTVARSIAARDGHPALAAIAAAMRRRPDGSEQA